MGPASGNRCQSSLCIHLTLQIWGGNLSYNLGPLLGPRKVIDFKFGQFFFLIVKTDYQDLNLLELKPEGLTFMPCFIQLL